MVHLGERTAYQRVSACARLVHWHMRSLVYFWIAEAILSLSPNSLFVVSGATEDDISWSNDVEHPSWEDIETKAQELLDNYLAKEYQRDRRNEYPSLKEQLDKLFHDIENGTLDTTGDFYNAIKAVKDNNPQPEEDEPS